MKKNLLLTFALIAAWFSGAFAQTTVDVKMTVNMAAQSTSSQVTGTTTFFDPSTDFVDVAGSFNSWNGADNHLTQVNSTDSINYYSVTISGIEVGTTLEFKFRINGSWADSSEFPGGGPNRKYLVRETGNAFTVIYNNYYPGWVPVKVNVNMNKVIADGNFDASTDWVDLAGTFNNWGNGGYDQLWDVADGVYSRTIIAPIDTMEWKTRINSDWNTSEFPGGGPNRIYVVKDTAGGVTNEVTVWYNDETAVKESYFSQVNLYPNPVNGKLTIDNLDNTVSQITVMNILGSEVRTIQVTNQTSVEVNTNDLTSGVYFVVIRDAENNGRAIKVVKQ